MSRRGLGLRASTLKLGELRGRGMFGSVYHINLTEEQHHRLRAITVFADKTEEDESSSSFSTSGTNVGASLVMKRVRKSVGKSVEELEAMAQDIQAEALLLNSFPRHKNIINLVGMSDDFLSSDDNRSKAFVILEELTVTLQQRLTYWKTAGRVHGSVPKGPLLMFPRQRRAQTEMIAHEQADRLSLCCIGIARALAHLHEHSILFLDLKPANVGFGDDGQVKIFDFGLSARCDDKGFYHPDGLTGTPRYMAPEVFNASPISYSSDMYSLGILMWEVCTLEKPFADYKTIALLQNAVVQNGFRPNISKVADPQAQTLIRKLWKHDPQARPTALEVLTQLGSICVDVY